MSRGVRSACAAAVLLLCWSSATYAQLDTPWLVNRWGTCCTGDGRFFNPRGVAVDLDGNLYVADTFNYRIQKFDRTGAFLTKWGVNGTTGDGEFSYPSGVAVDAAGHVFVADTFNDRIQKFDGDGVFLTKWGASGNGESEFQRPQGVAVDAAGNVYVADTFNDRIQKFTGEGVFLTNWGGSGTAEGEFRSPHGVAADGGEHVYVSDQNDRIQKFTTDGAFVTTWGTTGTGHGQFQSPQGVATDAAGNIYVADTFNDRVQKFDGSGEFLTTWGITGTGSAQFLSPQGVAADADGNLYVADQKSNNRIQKFAPSLEGLVAELLRSVASVDWGTGIEAALIADRDAAADDQGEEASQATDEVSQPVAEGPRADNAEAIEKLTAFIETVEAKRGVRLADAQAEFLIAAARMMIGSLGGDVSDDDS